MSNLSFTSREVQMKTLLEVAAKHGIQIKQDPATNGVARWTITNKLTIADVTNFINEAGYNGILVTASARRRIIKRTKE